MDPVWLPGVRTVDGPGTMVERTLDRALKALNLVLQSGVCPVVVIDMADVPPAALRRIPYTTWLRVQRVIEGSDTTCVLVAPEPLARSAGGVTLTMQTPGRGAPAARRPSPAPSVGVPAAARSPRAWRGRAGRRGRAGSTGCASTRAWRRRAGRWPAACRSPPSPRADRRWAER